LPPFRLLANSQLRLQLIVFTLVKASFTNIYITQPVLPVLQHEFRADPVLVSFTVSAVILGIALANLPFGYMADKLPVQPIILTGGLLVALGGLICAMTSDLWVLITARFLQGLFIPALTTCLAAYLAKTLPLERLNVVMGGLENRDIFGPDSPDHSLERGFRRRPSLPSADGGARVILFLSSTSTTRLGKTPYRWPGKSPGAFRKRINLLKSEDISVIGTEAFFFSSIRRSRRRCLPISTSYFSLV
jgi:hypothetical protein